MASIVCGLAGAAVFTGAVFTAGVATHFLAEDKRNWHNKAFIRKTLVGTAMSSAAGFACGYGFGMRCLSAGYQFSKSAFRNVTGRGYY